MRRVSCNAAKVGVPVIDEIRENAVHVRAEGRHAPGGDRDEVQGHETVGERRRAVGDADLRIHRDRADIVAASVRAEEPQISGDAIGGLLVETHGFVAAGELTRALVAAARAHGAQVAEQSRVQRITTRAGEAVVETNRGSLTGGAVVFAPGSWAGQIAIDGVSAPVPVRPVRGQLLWLGWIGQPLRRVTWSSRCYLVPWDDGTLLLGATVEEAGFEEIRTSLVPAPIVQPDAQAFQTFITTVICRPHLAHLASPALQEAFVENLTRKASADNPPFELDYWRLNIEARRPAD